MTQESKSPMLDKWFKESGLDKDEFFASLRNGSVLVAMDSEIDPLGKPLARPSGGRTNYYLVHVSNPQRENQPAYTAECEDIIEALDLNFDEANMFKEIWRSANARTHGNAKIGHSAIYGAEKLVHYAGRILRRMKLQLSDKDAK